MKDDSQCGKLLISETFEILDKIVIKQSDYY